MNSHITEYLSYYLSLDAPGYALLVTGAWGVGKTFQVTRALPKEAYVYVSLFDVVSVEDAYAAVYAAVHPTLAKMDQAAKGVGETANAAGDVFSVGGLFAKAVSSVLRREIDDKVTIVFDDLERSKLKGADILGVINFYVEHVGCKVIVIAHEGVMHDEFANHKEKIFGQSLRVQPEYEVAYDYFVQSLENGTSKDLVLENKDAILSVFKLSEVKSLRILRRVMEDIHRFSCCVSDDIRAESFFVSILRPFIALDAEVRVGNLREDGLQGRDAAKRELASIELGYTEGEKTKFHELIEKYRDIDIASQTLSDNLMVEMLVHGKFDPENIRLNILSSTTSSDVEKLQPVQILYGFDDYSDLQTDKALYDLLNQIEEKELDNPEELLRAFSFILFLAEQHAIDQSIDEVKQQGLDYVSILNEEGRVTPWGANEEVPSKEYDEVPNNHIYFVTKGAKAAFQEIWQSLHDHRTQAREEKYQVWSQELLETMQSDSVKFLGQVCYSSTGEGEYADLPVLSAIPPDKFVEHILNTDVRHWPNIRIALRLRYGHGINRKLSMEKEWLEQVIKLLHQALVEAKGVRALRIERLVGQISGLV